MSAKRSRIPKKIGAKSGKEPKQVQPEVVDDSEKDEEYVPSEQGVTDWCSHSCQQSEQDEESAENEVEVPESEENVLGWLLRLSHNRLPPCTSMASRLLLLLLPPLLPHLPVLHRLPHLPRSESTKQKRSLLRRPRNPSQPAGAS